MRYYKYGKKTDLDYFVDGDLAYEIIIVKPDKTITASTTLQLLYQLPAERGDRIIDILEIYNSSNNSPVGSFEIRNNGRSVCLFCTQNTIHNISIAAILGNDQSYRLFNNK